MVQISLPLPVGADMIALAILVVAVRGSMVVDVEEEEEPPAALGAMVVCCLGWGFLLFCVRWMMNDESVPKRRGKSVRTFTPHFPLVVTNKIEAYPVSVTHLRLRARGARRADRSSLIRKQAKIRVRVRLDTFFERPLTSCNNRPLLRYRDR